MFLNDYYVGVKPGERALNLMTNFCRKFVIGEADGDDVWLEGKMVGEDGEFVFNGRLFLKNGGQGTVIDNFPKGPTPAGWTRHPHLNGEGYDLRDDQGDVIFGYHVDDQICHITVNLYNAEGREVAHAGQGGLVLHQIGFAIS